MRQTLSDRSRSPLHPVLVPGVLVAIVEIHAAFVVRYSFTRTSPVRVLQGIASGLLGSAAFSSGAATAAIGMLLHLVIAVVVAAVASAAGGAFWWSTRLSLAPCKAWRSIQS
jgi:hypothetical protein